MKLVRALKYTQPVPVLVLTDADIALGYRLAAAEVGRREGFRRQFVDVTRLHSARHFTDVFNQIEQTLQ